MSRIGNTPIKLPSGVKVTLKPASVAVEGPKGKLEEPCLAPIKVEVKTDEIIVSRPSDSIANKVKHGTVRSLINNMVIGVTTGFKKTLLIEGVGFRAQTPGKNLNLQLGFSHPIEMPIPEGLTVIAVSATEISVEGSNKQHVGQFAAQVRAHYKPEPYKGKGIRYSDEVVRRKAGKSVAK